MPSLRVRRWRMRTSSASMRQERDGSQACCSSPRARTFAPMALAICPASPRSPIVTARHDTPRPALAVGKVRHVGQPVALVVAKTVAGARDAAEAIDVEYEPLPAVTEASDAIAAGAPQLFDHISGNMVFDWTMTWRTPRRPMPP